MKRPLLVWVIVLITVWGSVSIVRFYLGVSVLAESAPPELLQAFKQTGLVENTVKLLMAVLNLVAAIFLFRLMPLALPAYAAIFAVAVLQSVGGFFFSRALQQLVASHGLWVLLAGPVLNGLILWYVWRLKVNGRLHAQQVLPADATASRPRG